MALTWSERPMDPVPVALTRAHTGEVAVPNERRRLGQSQDGLLAALVEQA
jgi:hypothetical protein